MPFDCVTYLTLFVIVLFFILRHPCIYVLIFLGQKEARCNSDTSAGLLDILSSNVLILMLEE